MEWIFGLLSRILSVVSSKRVDDYKKKVKQLQNMLNKFEDGTVPMIEIENDDELFCRGKNYMKFREEQGHSLKNSLYPPIERVITELEKDRKSFWYKALKKVKYKI